MYDFEGADTPPSLETPSGHTEGSITYHEHPNGDEAGAQNFYSTVQWAEPRSPPLIRFPPSSLRAPSRQVSNLTALGARVYERASERLGMRAEAREAAEIGASQHRRGHVIADCQRTLGRAVAALEGGGEAATHFRAGAAVVLTMEQRWYMQAALAGRDWLRGGAGEDAAEAEAAIEAACSAMGKERGAFPELG